MSFSNNISKNNILLFNVIEIIILPTLTIYFYLYNDNNNNNNHKKYNKHRRTNFQFKFYLEYFTKIQLIFLLTYVCKYNK